VPDAELFFGRPSGSAMPLVWAHAEYIKLRRSLYDGRVFDMPHQAAQRYLVDKIKASHATWRFNQKCRVIPAGKILRVELWEPAVLHWSVDDWQSTQDTKTRDTGLGIHVADVPTERLAPASTVRFTLYWPRANRWEDEDFAVQVIARG
jgi:glucoamylase